MKDDITEKGEAELSEIADASQEKELDNVISFEKIENNAQSEETINPTSEIERPKGEVVEFSKAKIDKVLDSFIREQELAKEKEENRKKQEIRNKKIKSISIIIFGLIVIFGAIILILINPESKRYYNSYTQSKTALEEYSIDYNYSIDMEVLPFNKNLVIYNSSELKVVQKNGTEVFAIPFALGSWDMDTSNDRIYILDKIDKTLIFINDKGDFIKKEKLDNIPNKIYSSKAGNLILHYKSESGVEGITIFDKNGKVLEDTVYPKTTITYINVDDSNVVTVHGLNRTEPKLSNYVYRYSARGKLQFSQNFEDSIFVRQYENGSKIAFVDLNRIYFYNKNSNEVINTVDSAISAKLFAYDSQNENIYVLDKRNKLRILNFDGEVVGEDFFQSLYKDMIVYKDKLIMVGDDFIRTPSREIKYQDKIERVFEFDGYLVVLSKGHIKMMNKVE